MNTANECCYMPTESRFSMRTVSNYCSLVFLVLVLMAGNCFIQNASAQTASATMALVGPDTNPNIGNEFEISVQLVNPQNVYFYGVQLQYPTVFEYKGVSIGDGSVDGINNTTLDIRDITQIGTDQVSRIFASAYESTSFSAEAPIFSVKFQTPTAGNYQVKIIGTILLDNSSQQTTLDNDDLPTLDITVGSLLEGTFDIVPTIGTERVNEASFIDIELNNQAGVHHYEITVDPSENLGLLTVSYKADDIGTAVTHQNAGDPITLSAIVENANHADYYTIVATLFFTPTTDGEGSVEITAAEIFDSDDTALTLSNPDPLTFTIAESRDHVNARNTGTGPTPIITVRDRVKQGPFEIQIHFESENYIEQPINADASIRFHRGIYGFASDEIKVSGAGAFVTAPLWEADGGQLFYAVINPTETGAQTVQIWMEANAIKEVGTHLPNIASAVVTVDVNLTNPPWDVEDDGDVDEADVKLVTNAIGQGLVDEGWAYVSTIEDPRTDVNGDGYVTVEDENLVQSNIPPGNSLRHAPINQNTLKASQQASQELSAWMPDANLRKAVRKAIGIATDQDFTQEQLAALTKLTAVKARINDITGLEYATNLRKLDIRNNQVSDVRPLTGLTELRELAVGENNIGDITALANLTKLTTLGLSDNKITEITALGNLTKLTELWMLENNISDITVLENLTKLTYLNLKDNEVSNVTALGNLTKLTYLNLRYNEISDITALGSLTKLTELWMADNNISDVSSLSNLKKLKKLGLANNPILDTSPLYSLTQGALKDVDITVSQYPPWDVNEDGSVDATDSALVTAALGQTGAAITDPRTDVNGDGTVDQDDLILVTDNIGTDGGAPSIVALFTLLDREILETLDRGTLETYLNTLRAESDGSLKYKRAIAILKGLLAIIRPKQTQLLANYPNPFNPETWIPYQLANASDVQIIIYDTRGTVVRRLDFGHQPEGYYTSRSRAGYWDGRNASGERVASGIYFYQLQADNFSSLRKLLILK